jgi:hypothetical protein
MKTKTYFCPPDGLSRAPLATGSLVSGTCLGKNASLIPSVSPMANIASQKNQLVRIRSMGYGPCYHFCYPTTRHPAVQANTPAYLKSQNMNCLIVDMLGSEPFRTRFFELRHEIWLVPSASPRRAVSPLATNLPKTAMTDKRCYQVAAHRAMHDLRRSRACIEDGAQRAAATSAFCPGPPAPPSPPVILLVLLFVPLSARAELS